MRRTMHISFDGTAGLGDKVTTACGKRRRSKDISTPSKYACRECFDALYHEGANAYQDAQQSARRLEDIRSAYERLITLIQGGGW